MTDQKLCAQGHVIEPGREVCSRCNGSAVNAPAATEEASESMSDEQNTQAPAEEVNPPVTSEPAVEDAPASGPAKEASDPANAPENEEAPATPSEDGSSPDQA